MYIVLLGAPGSGKGTQSELLEQEGYYHFSMGDMLRREALTDSNIRQYLDSGTLVPADVIEACFAKVVPNLGDKVLFDGVPRNLDQAKMVDKILMKFGKKIDRVILLDLSFDKIVDRILNRWICEYNGERKILSGTREEAANACLGTLSRRSDDTIETVQRRIDVYQRETQPLVLHYKDILFKVDASQDKNVIFLCIKREIE